MNEPVKDPVCGMTVLPENALAAIHKGKKIFVCSEYCRRRFLEWPEVYLRVLVGSSHGEHPENRRIAYFSMEVAIDWRMPTYAGGLGVLAGDTLRSCADLRVPIVAVTLLPRKGYFHQRLDQDGWQHESPVIWNPENFLEPLPETVSVEIGQRTVCLRAWQYQVLGIGGYRIPLLFLDSDVETNAEEDRRLTDQLYGGDERYRLSQEIILGIGGVRMLRALGYSGIRKYHMNEGHAALLSLELLATESSSPPALRDFESVRDRCVFTTHTPVATGHDRFGYDLVSRVLGRFIPDDLLGMLAGPDRLNMTLLGLNLSRHVNGVARRHEEVTREMFPGYAIDHVTNGVHSWTWTSDELRALYGRNIPDWAEDPAMLRKAFDISGEEIWRAHQSAKSRLVNVVRQSGVSLAQDRLTIGFARRATAYKRAGLIFSDLSRLRDIAKRAGPLQLVFAGKAHPRDQEGKKLIQRIARISRDLENEIPVVYLENYDLQMARTLTSGVDLWLNSPEPPLEASGTSGMKAAHNGVPSLSTLDGWWLEGHVEGLTGWSIGSRPSAADRRDELADLYQKLEEVIVPLYYQHRDGWIDVMRHAIALNASHFNTHRVVQQYVSHAYLD